MCVARAVYLRWVGGRSRRVGDDEGTGGRAADRLVLLSRCVWIAVRVVGDMSLDQLYEGVKLSTGTSAGYFKELTCDVEYECKSGRTLVVKQKLPSTELAPLFTDVWTGSCVWECSMLMNRIIESEEMKQTFAGKQVLELGAGCGLSSIVACSETDLARIITTDRGGMVELARSNALATLPAEKAARMTCMALSWGDDLPGVSEKIGQKAFDVIVASDVINPIYGTDSWPALAKTISFFSDENTLILLAYEQRESEGPIEEDHLLNQFWRNCSDAGVFREATIVQEGEDRFVFRLKKTKTN